MNILFLISHQPNPRFIKQLNFLSAEDDVALAYFERSSLANINSSLSPKVELFKIGDIDSVGSYFIRIRHYFKGERKLSKHLKHCSYDLIVVNNLDTLILSLWLKFFVQRGVKVAIEISDLREFVFSSSIKARVLRKIEVFFYSKFVDKLVVTSPKYYDYHFRKFYKKPFFVLENKPLSSILPSRKSSFVSGNSKIVIGIVGLLLRGEEYRALFEVFKSSEEVEIIVYGKGKYQYLVEDYASKYPNIVYAGEYNFFTDAQKIYKSIDMIYVVYDTENGSMNNQLALPNKLYEAMYYCVPIICSKGTYLEEKICKDNIGLSIDFRNEADLINIVEWFTDNRHQLNDRFKLIKKEEYLADEDYDNLSKYLHSL